MPPKAAENNSPSVKSSFPGLGIIKKRPILRRIALWARDNARYHWYQVMGVGYIKREIAAGPNKGLTFYAGRRVYYSKEFWNGKYELHCCEFMQTLISQDAVCYDVGANLGYHTLIMARRAPGGVVYAFEPLVEVGAILKRNMMANRIGNVVVVEKAVTGTSGLVSLGRDISIDQAAIRWAGDRDPVHEKITCVATSLDDFVDAGNRPPSFIKIDVEGAEAEVLMGTVDTLSHFRPVVMCETHGVEVTARVYDILQTNGYRLFNVGDSVSPIRSVVDMPTNMYEGYVFGRPA